MAEIIYAQNVNLPLSYDFLFQVDLCPADGVAILLGLYLATLDLQCGHTNFTLNNLIATFITIDLLQLVGLQSYRTAAVCPLALHSSLTLSTHPEGLSSSYPML